MSDYKIFVELMVAGNLLAGLETIASRLTGINMKAGQVENTFSKWRPALLGAAAVIAGAGILGGLAKIADKSKDLLDAQDKLQRAGVSYNKTLQITSDYYNKFANQVPTAPADRFLNTVTELRSVRGDTASAEAGAPKAIMVDEIISNALHKHVEGEGFKLYRAIEQKGLWITQPAEADKLMSALAQDIVGAGGKLTAGDIQSMAKRGGVAWKAASDRFLAGPAMVIASDLGGDTAGTAMMTFYQLVSGASTMSKQQFGAFKDMGLIDMSKVSVDKGGRINAQPGAIRGYDLAMTDPDLWAQKFLEPGLAKASHGSQALADSYLAKIGRNRNATRWLMMLTDGGFKEQIGKDDTIWRGSSSVEKAYDDAMQRNPLFVQKAFTEQFHSMMEAIGGPLMQAAIPIMKEITSVFTYIGQFANANPTAIKMVGEALAALGVGLVAVGTVAIVGTVVAMGGLVGVLGGLAVAAGAFILFNWDAVIGWIKGVCVAMGDLASMGWQKIADLFQGIYNAILDFANKLASVASAIAGAFAHSGAPGQFSGTARGGIIRQSYVPPAGAGHPVVVHTALQLDGRTLAKAVGTHMARNSSWSNNSSTFDGSAMPPSTDMSFA